MLPDVFPEQIVEVKGEHCLQLQLSVRTIGQIFARYERLAFRSRLPCPWDAPGLADKLIRLLHKSKLHHFPDRTGGRLLESPSFPRKRDPEIFMIEVDAPSPLSRGLPRPAVSRGHTFAEPAPGSNGGMTDFPGSCLRLDRENDGSSIYAIIDPPQVAEPWLSRY